MRIVVADDNERYRSDLVDFLNLQGDVQVIGQARSGEEAVRMAHLLEPDMVMLDISMPGLGGMEATRIIKETHPATKVVFVTIQEESTYHILADLLHADGFVCKSNAKNEIPKVLRRLRISLKARN